MICDDVRALTHSSSQSSSSAQLQIINICPLDDIMTAPRQVAADLSHTTRLIRPQMRQDVKEASCTSYCVLSGTLSTLPCAYMPPVMAPNDRQDLEE
jgi:hypothetical protein